ncbi:MAG TPA: anti-sigma factor [Bacteroidota bacterium]
MTCAETEKLLNAYIDGELDLARSLEVEEHLRTCASCARARENHRVLRTALYEGSLYYEAPPGLETRVRAALHAGEKSGASPRIVPWGWRRLGIGLAVALVAVWSLVSILKNSSAESALEQELVSGHVRSLMADHLTDVVSSDQHTVKPWFNGKLDFSPLVSDLSRQGFALVGGRLEYMGNRPVAALVYQRRKHVINLYVWPVQAGADAGVKATMRQGYNLLRWTAHGMTFWAVSDIAPADLQELESILTKEQS